MRLIDADRLCEDLLTRWSIADEKQEQAVREIMANVVTPIVVSQPTITADRSKGEWIDIGDFEQCSVCKGTHLKEFQSYYEKTTWIKTPYCPYCGADMRAKESE